MEFNRREYETVILGALLHDIGKMLQRGSFGSLDTKGQHPFVSATFVSAFSSFFSRYVDYKLLLNLVQRHHEDPCNFAPDLLCQNALDSFKPLCYLVSRADNYSSSERGEKADHYQDFKATPLTSVFSSINLGRGLPQSVQHRTGLFLPDKLFPEHFEVHESYEVNNQLKLFGNDFAEFINMTKSNSFDVLFDHVLSLLLTYAWCFPSNTQEETPDISLYDHLKTTSAIAACLYQYHFPEFTEKDIRDDGLNKFILIVGDLSGIQKYIFNITHIGAGGTAKRLRARSLQVNIISDIIAHKILHLFKLPSANILMASGGKFYILTPNTAEAEDKISNFQTSIDEWFYNRFNAEINLNMAHKSLSGRDFKDYSKVVKDINVLLQHRKRKPFSSILHSNYAWNEGKMLLDVDFEDEESLCRACGRLPGKIREDGKFICDRCNTDKEIGQQLPKARYIAFYKNEKGRQGFS